MIAISIIICTRSRAQYLRQCLESFKSYYNYPEVEVLVVDNNNPSDLETNEILAQYPVRVIQQPKQGLSRSLNLGIKSASGDIIVFTDDDVVVNEHWLNKLLSNFEDKRVAYVSGQVLPLVMETKAQRSFEMKGGLSKGEERIEFDNCDFNNFVLSAFPVGKIAMGANSAVRKKVLEEVEYFDKKFGVGGFIGAGNTGDIVYRIMMKGYKVVYDPTAFVHHYHEPDYRKLRNKLYRYGKADTAQQTKFLIKYGDKRSLLDVFFHRPIFQHKRIIQSLVRKSQFPLDLIIAESFGNFIGPFIYLSSFFLTKETD